MKPVLIGPRPTGTLDEIFAWIARDDPVAAERSAGRIFEAGESASRLSERGAPRPELGKGARSIVVGRYLILYRIGLDSVDIVRIVHGARELRGLIGDPGK